MRDGIWFHEDASAIISLSSPSVLDYVLRDSAQERNIAKDIYVQHDTISEMALHSRGEVRVGEGRSQVWSQGESWVRFRVRVRLECR